MESRFLGALPLLLRICRASGLAETIDDGAVGPGAVQVVPRQAHRHRVALKFGLPVPGPAEDRA